MRKVQFNPALGCIYDQFPYSPRKSYFNRIVYPLFVRFLGNDSTSKYLPNRICQVDLNFNPKHNLVKASTLTQRLFLQVNNSLIYKWRRVEFLAISWQPNLLTPVPEHAATRYFPVRSQKKLLLFDIPLQCRLTSSAVKRIMILTLWDWKGSWNLHNKRFLFMRLGCYKMA